MAQLRNGPQFETARQRAEQMAQTANTLADLLLAWAAQQPKITQEQQEQKTPGVTDQQIVMFNRIKAKALAMLGRANDAVALLDPFAQQYPNDAGLLFSIAEAHYLDGSEAKGVDGDGVPHGVASLRTALDKFNELITKLHEEQDRVQTDPELREVYWATWMRVFQTIDALNMKLMTTPGAPNPYAKLTKDIPLRVKQLQQTDDINLGGEPYRTELQRLARKYA
jgi:hypothetical protein